MTLSLQKATQKPSWGSLDETDSAITTTELTEKKIKQLKARAISDVDLSCIAMRGEQHSRLVGYLSSSSQQEA